MGVSLGLPKLFLDFFLEISLSFELRARITQMFLGTVRFWNCQVNKFSGIFLMTFRLTFGSNGKTTKPSIAQITTTSVTLQALYKVNISVIQLLVFNVTPFKIDQNKNPNRSIDKFQNLGNERRYRNRDPRQDSGQRNIWYTRYPKKCLTQTYRDLYGYALLVLTWMSSNMADGNQHKHLLPRVLLQKREFILRETYKH